MRLPTRTLLVMSIAALVLAPIVAPASARPARVDAVTAWNATAGKAAVDGAKPLSQNAYKVTLARVAVKRALLEAVKQKA